MDGVIDQAQGFLIGPVSLIPLVIFIVQAVKEFEWVRGAKALRGLAMALGFPLLMVALAMERGLLPDAAVMWLEMVVTALWGTFGPSGIYALVKEYLGQSDE
jgi:hypothetical protein